MPARDVQRAPVFVPFFRGGPVTAEHGRPVLGDAPPSGDAIRRADAAMAASEHGLCPFCYAPIDEEGFCTDKECR